MHMHHICRSTPTRACLIGRYRSLPCHAMFQGESWPVLGRLAQLPAPFFFSTTKPPRDGACQLGGLGRAETPKCGGTGGRGSIGGDQRGVLAGRRPSAGAQFWFAKRYSRWSFLWDSRARLRVIGDGRNGLPAWTLDHEQLPRTPRGTVQLTGPKGGGDPWESTGIKCPRLVP